MKPQNKQPVKNWLRECFFLMIVCWVIIATKELNQLTYLAVLLVWAFAILTTFIFSIIQIKYYEGKFFAWVAVVVSFFLLAQMVLGLLAGYFSQ